MEVKSCCFVNPVPRRHAFATVASHHQVADSISPISDSLIAFASGSSRWTADVGILNVETNRAVVLSNRRGGINSITVFPCRWGALVACCGNGWEAYVLDVYVIGRDLSGGGGIKILARASPKDAQIMSNFVRFHTLPWDPSIIILSYVLNDMRGILQYAVRVKEDAASAGLELELELLQEVPQRDYPNCFITQEVELGESFASDEDTTLISACVNDGLKGSVFKVSRETGLVNRESEQFIDWMFQTGGVNAQDRSANQPHYCVVNRSGMFAVCLEREQKAVLIFPHVLRLNDRNTVPVALDFPAPPCNLCFSQDGKLLAVCTRKQVSIFSVTPFNIEQNLQSQVPLPVQKIDMEFSGITGICFSENRLFVSDQNGIYEFQILGVQTLKNTCIKVIAESLKDPESQIPSDWDQRLPLDLVEAIRPAQSEEVIFEGQVLRAADDQVEPEEEFYGDNDDDDDDDGEAEFRQLNFLRQMLFGGRGAEWVNAMDLEGDDSSSDPNSIEE